VTTTTERWLLTWEVAHLLHMSPKTISRWAAEGKLPHTTTLGGHRRYPESQILALRDQLTQPATNPHQDGIEQRNKGGEP
jgi:excisionase family DNA binding protein